MPTSPESIQVWVVRLTSYSAESWRPVLSNSEWEKTMRFRMPEDQLRSAVTRGVLRTLLARYLDVPATQIEFTQNQYGKLADPEKRIEFNVSHSGEYALLAFAKESPVGIDVEQIKGNRVVEDIAHRILSPAEYQRFQSLPDADRERTFFQIWALKESLLKAIGSGFSVAPECIEIAFYPDTPQLLSASTEQITNIHDWTLRSLDIGNHNYSAAVTVKHQSPSIEVNVYEN